MPVTMSAVTAGAGAIQGLVGYLGGRKARKQLENLSTPTYTPSKSISDYYNQALSRYQESPYQSNLYRMQAQNIARGTQTGLTALQDRRIGDVSSIVQNQNDAFLKAGVAAEQRKNQTFAQLGAASQAMAGEERQAFNINKMLPYQKQYDLLMQKAAGNAQVMNAGLQNMYGGGTSAAFLKANPYGGSSNPYAGDGYYGRQDPTGNDYYGSDLSLPSMSANTIKLANY